MIVHGTSCPACHGDSIDIVEIINVSRLREVWTRHYPGTDHLSRDGGDRAIRMLGCADCDLEWADSKTVADPTWYDAISAYPRLRWEYDIALHQIGPQARVLELGCGPGHFLRRAREAGVAVVGLDTSEAAVRAAQSFQLAAVHGGVLKAIEMASKVGSAPFVVVAFHFIEHVADLEFLGSGLSRLANEVHLSFPNPNRWTRYLLPSWRAGEHEMWNYPPWHQARWSKRAIEAFASRFRFNVVDYLEEPLDVAEAAIAFTAETGLRAPESRAAVEGRVAWLTKNGTRIGGRSCYARLVAGGTRPSKGERY